MNSIPFGAGLRDLRTRVRPALGDGTGVLLGLQAATTIIRFGSNLILTRLFVPEVYGMIGIITAIYYMLNMVSDMGLNAFITRHPDGNHKMLQSVWTIRFVRNVVLATVMFLGAGLFAQFYAAPELTFAIRAWSGLFLFEAVTSISLIYAVREQRVIRISVIEFLIFLAITIVTIALAFYLRSYWAIVFAMFFGAVLRLIASYALIPCSPMTFRWDRKYVRELWKYMRVVMPASVISIVLTQTDKFYLANYFPLDELGKFMLASTVALAVSSVSSQYGGRVFFPLFAKAYRDDREKAKTVYYASRRKMAMFFALCFGGLMGAAEFVVRFLFNDLYLGAEFYLSIVAIFGLATLTTAPSENALITIGKISTALTAKILRLVWVVVGGIGAFYLFDAKTVIVALCMTEAVVIPYFWWRLNQAGFLKLREELIIFGTAAVGFLIGHFGNGVIEGLVASGVIPRF